MANTLPQVQQYITGILDEVYKRTSVSAILDMDSELVRDIEGMPGTVQIPSISFSGGLADYNKSTGAVAGDVTLEWQAFKLTKDRARKFTIDSVDNMESAGVALANLASQFMRVHVIPEIDAYRFGIYAGKAPSGQKVAAAISNATIEGAIETGIETLMDNEVPKENLVLFMSNAAYTQLKGAVKGNRLLTGRDVTLGVANYDDVPVYLVPSGRFNDKVSLTASGGFTTSGNAINFLLMDRASAVQVVKHTATRLFAPQENIEVDGYQWRYRVYHDAFVPDNKANGIYLHTAAAAG